MVALIVFLAIALPVIGVLAWMLFSDSVVRIEPGQLGLLLVRGRPTDKVLDPGVHWVPALRRRTVAEYPALELSYRAARASEGATSGELERVGPAPAVALGDRTRATVDYTVRFRLDQSQLRIIHDRVGAPGIWALVRDRSSQAVRARLADPSVGVDSLFGEQVGALESAVGAMVTEALAADGINVVLFGLGDVDLGRTGEVVQATARARLELEREEAEAALRRTRARIDAELEPYLSSGSDVALRYREVDAWRELARVDAWLGLQRAPAAPAGAGVSAAAPGEPREATEGEPTADEATA